MKITRPKNKTDLVAAKDFMVKIIKEDFGYSVNEKWHWDVLNLESTYLLDKGIFFVAKIDEEIVGTIGGRPYDRKIRKFKDKYTKENTLGIWRHYVTKQKRGKGIGSKMLSKLIKFAKDNEYKFLYLHTQKSIPGSLEYWLAKKFEITLDEKDNLSTVHLEKKI